MNFVITMNVQLILIIFGVILFILGFCILGAIADLASVGREHIRSQSSLINAVIGRLENAELLRTRDAKALETAIYSITQQLSKDK